MRYREPTMSQKSPLLQSAEFVSKVLMADTFHPTSCWAWMSTTN